MSDLWIVHRENETFGPWSAAEVREALRDGRIDPFDLVSRSGSAVKVELVEVDEIFQVKQPQPVKTTRESRAFHDIERAEGEQLAQAAGDRAYKRKPQMAVTSAADQRLDKNKQEPSGSKRSSRRREHRDPKKFFLIDRRKRQLGPLSAREIQSLFFRGIVGNSVKVIKVGTLKQVPVGQFVSIYAGARAQSLSGHTQIAITKPAEGLPSSRVMDEIARLRHVTSWQGWPLPLLYLLAAMAAGGVAYIAMHELFWKPRAPFEQQWPGNQKQVAPRPTIKDRPPAPSAQPKSKQAQKRPVPRKQSEKKQPAAIKRAPKNAPMVQPARRKAVQRVRPMPTVMAPTTMAHPIPRRTQPRPLPMPRVNNRARPRPMPRPAPVRASTQTVASQVGKVATFPGMKFSPAALSGCDVKCEITFSGPAGSVTAIFFKAAHAANLQRAGGAATITGRVAQQGGRYVMYLQDAR